jgi:hypothetical protein
VPSIPSKHEACAAMSLIDRRSENSRARLLVLLLPALASVIAAGCSQSNPLSGVKLYPVKGKVTLSDGKPLTSGRVAFVGTKTTITSSADIESNGAFTFKGASGEGLPEGEYKVRFEVGSSVKGAGGKLKATAPFAMKYLDEDASKVLATVEPDASKNNFEFVLQKHDPADQRRSDAGDRRSGR